MSRRYLKSEDGFTLLELLISVAMIVLLAAVGIPVYQRFMQNSKHAEANTNLSGIKIAQEGYRLTEGTYVDCPQHPAAAPDRVPDLWTGNANYNAIGFSTSSKVRFVYQVSAISPIEFVGEALGDTDGDGDRVLFIITEDDAPHLIGTKPGDAGLTLALGTMGDTAD